MPDFTLCTSYYRQPAMLRRQIEEWEQYPASIPIVVVDDGSPEPARDVLADASDALKERLRLYRIAVDLPWNREGARNLAAQRAKTDWLVMVDLDHVLPVGAAMRLLDFTSNPSFWYRFPRFRQGAADETRQKDKLPKDATFGPIHEHIDSYLITAEAYAEVGGYDEAFVGCLGGGCEFLRRLEWHYGAPLMLPAGICLHVYTRHVIPDASVTSLSRDREEGKRRERKKGGTNRKPERPIRFEWAREL